MFGKIGTTELILILAVVLLIFGPSRLPALGKMMGGAFGKVRKQAQEWDVEEEEEEETVKKAEATEKSESAEAAPAKTEAAEEE